MHDKLKYGRQETRGRGNSQGRIGADESLPFTVRLHAEAAPGFSSRLSLVMAGLPVELVQHIVESCAFFYPRETRHSLLTVSRAFFNLAAPFACSVFTFDEHNFGPVTRHVLLGARPLLCAPFTKTLCIQADLSSINLGLVDRHGVAGLETFGHANTFVGPMPMLAIMVFHAAPFKPYRTYITNPLGARPYSNLGLLAGTAKRLASITHLRIADPIKIAVTGVKSMRNLKHLVFEPLIVEEGSEFVDCIGEILQRCRSLQRLDVVWTRHAFRDMWGARSQEKQNQAVMVWNESPLVRDERVFLRLTAAEEPPSVNYPELHDINDVWS